ncbi:MAG: oligosaccharide flippase family protein [Prevotella sp.]|nr:oligosaccharide flippase family protein [Prevotella sp.]
MSENEKGAYGQVLKYTGIFGGVQGLSIIVSLVRNKLAAVLLGPAGMGLVSLFNSTVAFISQATGFGISMSAVRHISELTESGDEAQRAYYIKVVRAWSLLAAMLGVLVCVAIGPFLSSNTFAWGNHTLHFILLAPAVGMIAVTAGESAILKGTRQLKPLVVVQTFTVLATLLLTVPAYYFFGEAGIVPVIVLMALVTLLFTINYSFRLYPYHVSGSKGILGDGMEMIRLGVAYTLAGIVGTGSEMLIRSWLNLQGDLDAVGLYNAGYMITVTYASMVFSAMEADYFPRLSAVNGDVTATNETVNKQMEVTMLIIAPMLVGLIVLLPVLIPLLLSEKFLPIVAMTQVAALAMFFKAITLPAAFITLARGYSLIFLALETAYYIVFVLLVMFGYRHWGLMGTGVAITLANVFDFLMIHGVARWRYGYKMSSAVMRYSAIHILIGLLAFFTTITVDGFGYWVFGIGLLLVSLMFSLVILHQKTHLWTALMKRLPWLRKTPD